MREKTVKALIAHRFDAEEKSLCAEAEDFGRAVWADIIGADAEKLAKLPAHWFKSATADHFGVPNIKCPFTTRYDHESNRYEVRLRSKDLEWYWPIMHRKSVPVPFKLAQSTLCIARDSVHWPLAEALAQRAEKLREARNEAEAKTSGILSAFTTVHKLVAAWPEVEPFLPGYTPHAAPPAIPAADMNALLRLP
jgi:hypothetical protein